jgi:hypothetical protein
MDMKVEFHCGDFGRGDEEKLGDGVSLLVTEGVGT